MAPRKAFLLRIDPDLWNALEKWAADELRSVNGQIEYLLTRDVREAGRERKRSGGRGRSADSGSGSTHSPARGS
ncbi:MAG TPA: hypothetical protein VID50_10180 [Candidatus Eisenbacteria bacterium]|jgi:hypothetical protein